jgi:hypothetical protein
MIGALIIIDQRVITNTASEIYNLISHSHGYARENAYLR